MAKQIEVSRALYEIKSRKLRIKSKTPKPILNDSENEYIFNLSKQAIEIKPDFNFFKNLVSAGNVTLNLDKIETFTFLAENQTHVNPETNKRETIWTDELNFDTLTINSNDRVDIHFWNSLKPEQLSKLGLKKLILNSPSASCVCHNIKGLEEIKITNPNKSKTNKTPDSYNNVVWALKLWNLPDLKKLDLTGFEQLESRSFGLRDIPDNCEILFSPDTKIIFDCGSLYTADTARGIYQNENDFNKETLPISEILNDTKSNPIKINFKDFRNKIFNFSNKFLLDKFVKTQKAAEVTNKIASIIAQDLPINLTYPSVSKKIIIPIEHFSTSYAPYSLKFGLSCKINSYNSQDTQYIINFPEPYKYSKIIKSNLDSYVFNSNFFKNLNIPTELKLSSPNLFHTLQIRSEYDYNGQLCDDINFPNFIIELPNGLTDLVLDRPATDPNTKLKKLNIETRDLRLKIDNYHALEEIKISSPTLKMNTSYNTNLLLSNLPQLKKLDISSYNSITPSNFQLININPNCVITLNPPTLIESHIDKNLLNINYLKKIVKNVGYYQSPRVSPVTFAEIFDIKDLSIPFNITYLDFREKMNAYLDKWIQKDYSQQVQNEAAKYNIDLDNAQSQHQTQQKTNKKQIK